MLSRITEVMKYRSMLYGMISSELRTRYKGSVLGFLWTFVNPLLTLVVYYIVFKTVMRVQMDHYTAFLFVGLLAWNMFSSAALSATGVIIRQANLVKKIYFPREILPLSVVGASVVNYVLSLLILIPFLLLSGFRPSWLWAYLPLILLVETLIASGFGLLLASVNVYLRDVEHMLGIIMLLWFYMSPVVYSVQMIPHRYAQVFSLNPMTGILSAYQSIFYFGRPPDFLYSIIFSLAITVVGWLVFNKLSRRFAEEV